MAFLVAAVIVPATGHAEAQVDGADPFDGADVPARIPVRAKASAARPWSSNRSVLALNLGLGSAIGELGATYAFWPTRFFSAEMGFGAGLTGTQYSLMGKFSAGREDSRLHFVAGVGVSYASGTSRAPDPSVWLNLDLAGLEVRSAKGFVFFLAGGFTIGMAGGKINADMITDSDCSPFPACQYRSKVPGLAEPQFRLGIGRWF